MTDQPTGGVNLNVEGDGVREGTVAWVGIAALVIGLIAGGWAAHKIWGYTVSEEYTTNIVLLETRLAATGDSLDMARREVSHADAAVDAAESATVEALDDLASARYQTSIARQRADASAARAVGARAAGASETEIAEAEAEAARDAVAAVEADRVQCAACAATVGRQAESIGRLHDAVESRDAEIAVLGSRIIDLRDALTLAQDEVARASGRLVRRWYHPVVTAGYGCQVFSGGGCGLSVSAGFSFSPMDLIRRFR